MGHRTHTQETTHNTGPSDRLKLRVPDEARILIVCDDDSITAGLRTTFWEAGLITECAKSITEGCESARSGRFQVVFSVPFSTDGSWRRLVDIGNHYDLGFVVVLVARTFDLNQCTKALEDGAFDVLDALHELPKSVEAAKSALWAAYLKGAGHSPRAANLSMAA